MKKLDVVAVVGEYVLRDGQIKNRYKTVGEIHEKQDGGMFLLMDKSFNLMAVRQKNPNDDKVVLSLYEPKPKENNQLEQSSNYQSGNSVQQDYYDDEIPF